MRTLNRPMFRYGGPIKEGVMNGIREPKKQGGSMGTHAALVGNPVFPTTNGRAHYEINYRFNPIKTVKDIKKAKSNIVVGGIKKGVRQYAPGLEGIGGRTINRLKNFYNKNIQTMPKLRRTDTSSPVGLRGRLDGSKISQNSLLDRIKYFGKQNPKTTIGGAYVASPAVVGAATSFPYEKAVKQVGDLLVPDFIFDQDEYFEKKEKAKKDAELAEKNAGLNTDINKLLEQPATPKKSEEELRAEQISKYRDIVDIKGMNKNATYDALIAASQAVLGDGDFKGSLKDGSLINKIIGSTSKAFDKPKATKDAIDTLILKGEIEKDMNKDKNAIMDAYRMKQIALADKQLSGGGFSENKGVLAKTMSGQTLFDTAAAKSSPNFMGNLMTKTDLTDLMTEAKKKGDIVERDIIINTTEELIKGKGVPNGDYTVGDVLVTIVNGKVANVTR